MARTGMIEAEGTVDSIKGGGFYFVTLENGRQIRAKLSGRLRKFRILVLPGDKVRCEVSEYDVTQGFIVYRTG